MPETQIPLIPDRPLNIMTHDALAISKISYTLTTPPTPAFLESVRQLGVIQPVLVRATTRNRYQIIAGRRRVEAAKQAGFTTVPAIILMELQSGATNSALAVVENAHRAPNPIGDLEAIEAMVQAGAGPQQIADELGLSLSTIRQRMRLGGLSPTAREAVRQGRLSMHLANYLARRPNNVQDEVLSRVPAGDRITVSHVRGANGSQSRGATGRYSQDTAEMFSPAVMGAATVVGQAMNEDGEAFDIILWRNERWVPEVRATSLVNRVDYSGWGGVLALLNEIDRVMPVEPNDDTDAFYAAMQEMRDRVARRTQT